MDFFQHQDLARKQTRYLLLLFILAVISLITITTLFVATVLYFSDSYTGFVSQPLPHDNTPLLWRLLTSPLAAGIAVVVLVVVAMGSLYKWLQLAAGGEQIALSLGGMRLLPSSDEPNERRLLNIVEEMAIASGTPVPPVFLLEEPGINAFAAGHAVNDAVIGVTRGCMERLDRDELQGVIGHEFSHILNGDMRINMRLIGILHGILVIGLIGSMLMRSGAHTPSYRVSSDNRRESGGLVLMGLGLIVIGYCGTFFGKLIKAAVSRQREFLADAAAVQFTRNPEGISRALQKIGGFSHAALIQHPNAEEFSHLYFGDGLHTAFGGWLATHPPLEQRIRRITPAWNGRYPMAVSAPDTQSQVAAEPVSPPAAVSSLSAAESVLASLNATEHAELAHASELLQAIPLELLTAARDSFSARALAYGLLMIYEPVRDAQWAQLEQKAHPVELKHTRALLPRMQQLAPRLRLPLLELSIPALKGLSPPQYQVFKSNVIALIRADDRVNVFEWALYRMLLNALEPRRSKGGQIALKHLAVPCQQLLSTLASAGSDAATHEPAYTQAMAALGFANLPILGEGKISLPLLDSALTQLRQLAPLDKPKLLKVMLQCIAFDKRIDSVEYELFRAIADCLDCPLPPLDFQIQDSDQAA